MKPTTTTALAPLALAATGCFTRPFTPSTHLVNWGQPLPDAVEQSLPTSGEAMAQWQLPVDDPWYRYNKLTLLASLDATSRYDANLPDVHRLEIVQRAQCAAAHVARSLGGGALWLVDLRGAASVAFGATLSRDAARPVSPVLTFNNWPGENELIPAEETLAALLAFPPRPAEPGRGAGTVPVFLLDAWRLAFRDQATSDDVTDNRYMLTPADVPDPATLRAQGITDVVYVVEDLNDTETEEDDLHLAMLAYQAAGLRLTMVDLATLCPGDGSSVDLDLSRLRLRFGLTVRRRRTLCDDGDFYARARGGFGGVHAGPSPFRTGMVFHGRPYAGDDNGGSGGGGYVGGGGYGGWHGGHGGYGGGGG